MQDTYKDSAYFLSLSLFFFLNYSEQSRFQCVWMLQKDQC